MYKWHVNSAIGRGRPFGSDLARVADGIATSLRQFSVSVSGVAEDNNGLRITRSQRSAKAVTEVSSLSPPSRGIDARALAATPSAGFTIRRIDESGTSNNRRDSSNPRARGGFGNRGRGGAGRGGAARAKGGRRGVAAKRGKGRPPKEKDPNEPAPLTKEELAASDGVVQGFAMAYTPVTTLESLKNLGPSFVTSGGTRGLERTVVNGLQALTGDYMKAHPKDRLAKLGGNGTLVESDEELDMVKRHTTWRPKYDEEGEIRTTRYNEVGERIQMHAEVKGPPLPKVPEAHRSAILQSLVGGQHVRPKPDTEGDIIGLVERYARRNETYLSADTERLKAKLKALLPAQSTKQAPGTVKATL